MKKIILFLSIITASILFESCKGCEVFIFNKRIEKKHKVKKVKDKDKTFISRLKNIANPKK